MITNFERLWTLGLLGVWLSIFAGNATAYCTFDRENGGWTCYPPRVGIASSPNGMNPFPTSFSLTAAVDNSGGVGGSISVAFYVNDAVFQTVTAAPYSVTYTPPAPGTYTFQAAATDNNTHGTRTGYSNRVTVTADNPPTISIASNASTVNYPGSFTFTANASDSDGSVTGVTYYSNGSTPLGSGAGANWSLTWTPPAAGSYSITGVATDNVGVTTTSAAISIKSNAAPTVSITSPTAGAVFQAPATITITANAADTDGTVAKVEFYDGATFLGQGTANGNNYVLTWSNAPVGIHAVTAKATDNSGAVTTSGTINLTVSNGRADPAMVPNGTAPFGGSLPGAACLGLLLDAHLRR